MLCTAPYCAAQVLILRKLRGTLNVVHLSAAYEDDSHVHIIMEYCRGGELFHKMGRRHYSEQTVRAPSTTVMGLFLRAMCTRFRQDVNTACAIATLLGVGCAMDTDRLAVCPC